MLLETDLPEADKLEISILKSESSTPKVLIPFTSYPKGKISVSLDISNFSNGSYIVFLKGNFGVLNNKLLINR